MHCFCCIVSRWVFCNECGLFITNVSLHQIWHGSYWKSMSLYNAGLSIQLGHNGLACTSPHQMALPLTVYHMNSTHLVQIAFCQCSQIPGGYSHSNQLLPSNVVSGDYHSPQDSLHICCPGAFPPSYFARKNYRLEFLQLAGAQDG